MQAMVTMGHGGLERLVWHKEWPVPAPAPGEVLIRVRACGLNNTDINTRVGWYSKAVTGATNESKGIPAEGDPTWGGTPIRFPRIQGADVCGEIVAVGDGVDAVRIGERVITDNWLRDPDDPENKEKTGYFGSERDGGYAQFTTLPSRNALKVNSDLSDAELATFSCAYSTAEGMLCRAQVAKADTVLVTGASGGVGGALVQLAKWRRGARVIALASEAKHADVAALGADRVLPRMPDDLHAALKDERITVLADVVGGAGFGPLLETLVRGGRYTCSGAIAGPIVEFDLRTFYLRDLTFTGSTVIDLKVMPNLIGYIEAGAIRPALAATYPLSDLHAAQTAFIGKQHAGNIVVLP
ncbi:MAG: alcohol dehydrogenase family protein [Rhodobacteraceae bacterium]|nr:alcohol dehydrogenase family protein [Paracoccaceae bacterium]